MFHHPSALIIIYLPKLMILARLKPSWLCSHLLFILEAAERHRDDLRCHQLLLALSAFQKLLLGPAHWETILERHLLNILGALASWLWDIMVIAVKIDRIIRQHVLRLVPALALLNNNSRRIRISLNPLL